MLSDLIFVGFVFRIDFMLCGGCIQERFGVYFIVCYDQYFVLLCNICV